MELAQEETDSQSCFPCLDGLAKGRLGGKPLERVLAEGFNRRGGKESSGLQPYSRPMSSESFQKGRKGDGS